MQGCMACEELSSVAALACTPESCPSLTAAGSSCRMGFHSLLRSVCPSHTRLQTESCLSCSACVARNDPSPALSITCSRTTASFSAANLAFLAFQSRDAALDWARSLASVACRSAPVWSHARAVVLVSLLRLSLLHVL